MYRLIAPALAAVLCFGGAAPANAEPPAALGNLTGTVIWVDFWASWCAPCRRSFPWLNSMHTKYGNTGFQVVGVNLDKERELAVEFLAETPAKFTISYDPEGQLAVAYDVQAMPSSFLIDRDGNILARHYGFKVAHTKEYEQTITEALVQVASSTRLGDPE